MGRNNDDDLDLKIKYEKFAGELVHELEEVKKFVGFLALDEKEREVFSSALKILANKTKKIRKCSSLKDAKEYVKLKKINNDY